MPKDSDRLERTVTRIHHLLEPEGSEVEWNERISDPDNPIQLRQIDVSIRRDGFLNIVECRDHAAKQDVKWIEELIGRRASLRADGIAAVAANGFTKGAIRKAAQYGIPLFDLLSLTDQQIQSWSRSIEFSLFFFHYKDYLIKIFINEKDLETVDPEALCAEFEKHPMIRTVFEPANQLMHDQNLIVDENVDKQAKFSARFKIDDFLLQGKEVLEFETSGRCKLERMELSVPETLSYGGPVDQFDERSVFVQQFNLGETQVIHRDGSIVVSLDIGALDLPPLWQFCYCKIGSEHVNNFESFEILGAEKFMMKAGWTNVVVVASPNQPMQADQPPAGR